MSLNDLMSDYIARVNNARLAQHNQTKVLKNKLTTSVSKKLTTLGYLNGFKEDGYTLVLDLNLDKIRSIKRISKPGQRVYAPALKTPRVTGGIGFNILTTSKGILTHIEAKRENVGGEVLFQIF